MLPRSKGQACRTQDGRIEVHANDALLRSGGLDRQLIVCTLALIAFGLAILYSAGQTDVPSAANGVWKRQMVWLGIGAVARSEMR